MAAQLPQPRISVVIPAYNEAAHLEACLRSLNEQDIGPVELLVVDDGSSDGTAALASSLGATVLTCGHRGPGAARNVGARAATGNILVFADADMTFAREYLSRLVEPIVAGGAMASCHWNETVANWSNPWARCETWFLGFEDRRREPITPPEHQFVYRAVRRDFFLASGGYAEDEGRGDDSSVARKTGVYASIAVDAVCFHNNASGPAEVFSDALWRGKGIAVGKTARIKTALTVFLWLHNPALALLRGLRLAFRKGEPRLPVYAVVFSAGVLCGLAVGLMTGRYQK